ncbi:MAG: hypothetical protein HY319_21300 [Armatimonadetes bacterium]|nr:hypothetical protein [Armatimonadota bacterium]
MMLRCLIHLSWMILCLGQAVHGQALEALRERFNQERGRVRLVSLLSPT